jgi:3-dehydroquinate synthase
MKSILISAEREYQVDFDRDWKSALAEITGRHAKTMIIAPRTVVKVYELESLVSDRIILIPTPEGENAKSTEMLLQMWEECGRNTLTRSDCIVGIGGGATTDLAGFVAASWLRGISWYAIPTSLVGMVDAAIGGKTGINSEYGKNLIGSFNSPSSVTIDPSFLETLPERDFNAGMAEIIKSGFIADAQILQMATTPIKEVAEMISRTVSVKAHVVGQDFREGKLREILNYGHTLGHAIEKREEYRLRHGEAVAIGLVFAAELSNVLGKLDSRVVEQHRELLTSFELPISYDKSALPELLDLMANDKKTRGSKLRFIGLEAIGKPIWLENVGLEQISLAYERISL